MKKNRLVLENLLYVMKYVYQWKKSIYLSIVVYSIFLGVSPFIWIFTPKLLIDELTAGGEAEKLLKILILALLLSGATGFATEYLQGNFRMKMNAVRYGFIRMLSDKAMKMRYHYTEDPKTLNDIHIALETIQNPQKGIGLIILKLFSIPGNLIGFFVFMAILYRLNPLILLLLVLTVYLSYLAMVKAKNYERGKKDELAKERREFYYGSATMSDFQYGKDIRIYGLKKIILSKNITAREKILSIVRSIQKHIFKASLMEGVLSLLREGIVYLYLIQQVVSGSLTIGDFVMYTMAMNNFITWMEATMKDLADIRIQALYVSDFREFLKKEEPVDSIKIEEGVKVAAKGKNSKEDISKEENPIEQYSIEFRKVSFLYPGSSRYIFKDFSLKIKGGERLALVGINGAGKTTLVKLLTGLYQPDEGQILINGKDSREYTRTEYNDLFSVVFQDIKILSFTIKENITFKDGDINKMRYEKALVQSGLKEKISSLTNKDNTMMLKVLDEEGTEFSGGENQKLAMARALYKDGNILIMDEPTAALDALAEYKLYQEFDAMVQEKTAIYISHRLSSTRFCDAIAFLENGKIIEYGTHEELMKLNGAYANMFQIQAAYYQEEKANQKKEEVRS